MIALKGQTSRVKLFQNFFLCGAPKVCLRIRRLLSCSPKGLSQICYMLNLQTLCLLRGIKCNTSGCRELNDKKHTFNNRRFWICRWNGFTFLTSCNKISFAHGLNNIYTLHVRHINLQMYGYFTLTRPDFQLSVKYTRLLRI